jgi:hypothetical protein
VPGGQPNPNNVRGKNLSGPGGLARVSGAALPIPPLNAAAVGSSSSSGRALGVGGSASSTGSSVATASAAAAAASGGGLSPRSEHAVMQAAARLAPAVQQQLIQSVARRSDTKIELKRSHYSLAGLSLLQYSHFPFIVHQ